MFADDCFAATAFAEWAVEPAKTPRGRAGQLEQMLIEFPEVRARYGPLIERMIAELRRAGKRPDGGKSEAARTYLQEQLTAGRKLTPALKKEAAAKVKCDPSTVSRAIRSLQI